MPICRECGSNYSYAKADLNNGVIPDPTICINCVRKDKSFKDDSFVEGKKSRKKKDKEEIVETPEPEEIGGYDE